jgi:hypothetical protein
VVSVCDLHVYSESVVTYINCRSVLRAALFAHGLAAVEALAQGLGL